MKRREMLAATGAAVAGLAGFPLGWAAEPKRKNRKLLYFTRSIAYEHSILTRLAEIDFPAPRLVTTVSG